MISVIGTLRKTFSTVGRQTNCSRSSSKAPIVAMVTLSLPNWATALTASALAPKILSEANLPTEWDAATELDSVYASCFLYIFFIPSSWYQGYILCSKRGNGIDSRM